MSRAARRAGPAPRTESEHLRVAMEQGMAYYRVAKEALELLVAMERAGALRLPFHQHPEVVARLRATLGIKEG